VRLLLALLLCLLPALAGAAPLGFTVATSKSVVVDVSGGVPRVWLDFGGGEVRAATYRGGSGTQVLEFAYDVVAGDFAPAGIVASGEVDLAGGAIRDVAGNPLTLTFTPPDLSGVKVQTYRAAWTTDPITSANASAAAFQISKPPPGATFAWQIASDGGGSVSGSGTITASPHAVTGLDLTALADGTLTLTVTLTTPAGTGAARTATVAKGTGPWSPADLGPALALWFDADDAATLTFQTTQAVSEWRDKSGKGRHAVQANGNLQPTLTSVGGRAALRWDGVDDRLATPLVRTSFGDYGFFGVIAYEGSPTRFYSGVLGSNDGWFFLGKTEGATSLLVQDGACCSPYAGTDALFDGSRRLLSHVATGNQSRAFIDGTQRGAAASSPYSGNALNLGWEGSPQNSWQGLMHEVVLVATTLAAPERQRIEGYLAWKWGLQGNLPVDHPWKAAPPAGWSPADLGGALDLWFDADDASTLTLQHSVSEWRDKSGNGRHVGQAVPAQQPVLSPGALNGRQTVLFDGANDFLSATGVGALGVNDVSFFVLMRYVSGSGEDLPVAIGQTGAGRAIRSMYRASGGTTHAFGTWTNDAFSNLSADVGGAHHLFEAVQEGQSVWFWRTGVAGSPQPRSLPNMPIPVNFDGIAVGSQQGGAVSNYFTHASVAEVVVSYTALAAPERQRIEGYLAWKWGLQGNLPADHPWKAAPP
jgi:hypothetical protein